LFHQSPSEEPIPYWFKGYWFNAVVVVVVDEVVGKENEAWCVFGINWKAVVWWWWWWRRTTTTNETSDDDDDWNTFIMVLLWLWLWLLLLRSQKESFLGYSSRRLFVSFDFTRSIDRCVRSFFLSRWRDEDEDEDEDEGSDDEERDGDTDQLLAMIPYLLGVAYRYCTGTAGSERDDDTTFSLTTSGVSICGIVVGPSEVTRTTFSLLKALEFRFAALWLVRPRWRGRRSHYLAIRHLFRTWRGGKLVKEKNRRPPRQRGGKLVKEKNRRPPRHHDHSLWRRQSAGEREGGTWNMAHDGQAKTWHDMTAAVFNWFPIHGGRELLAYATVVPNAYVQPVLVQSKKKEKTVHFSKEKN
jgi:hypothetical protein